MILKGTKTRKTEHCTTELFEKYSKITKSPAASGAQGFSGLLIFWIGISVFIALGTFTFRGNQIKRDIKQIKLQKLNKLHLEGLVFPAITLVLQERSRSRWLRGPSLEREVNYRVQRLIHI